MRRTTQLWLAILLILASGEPLWAAPITIPVHADASVHEDAPNMNFGSDTFGGGLQTGATEFGELFRFYVRFDLSSAATAGQSVQSATLRGFYSSDWDFFVNERHSLYRASTDAWTESAITWNNQPGASGSPVASFDAAYDLQRTSSGFVGLFLFWDLTSAVNAELAGDRMLSLLFRANNETLGNPNLEFFAAREFDPSRAFRLEVEVPDHATTLLLLGPVLAVLFRLSRKQKHG